MKCVLTNWPMPKWIVHKDTYEGPCVLMTICSMLGGANIMADGQDSNGTTIIAGFWDYKNPE